MSIIFLKKKVRANREHVICMESDDEALLAEEKAVYVADGWQDATPEDFANQKIFISSRGSVVKPSVTGENAGLGRV